MKTLAAFVLLAACAVAAEPAQPAPQITFAEIASPAGPRAIGASLTTAPDGTRLLSWVESGAPLPAPATATTTTAATDHSAMAGHQHGAMAAPAADAPANTLRFATYDATAKEWSAARTIFSGATVPTSAADFPLLAVDGRGQLTALWASAGKAFTTTSTDRGATWSPPATWTTTSDVVEKFSLATLADGRVLVAWLDGRNVKSGGKTQLYARILGQSAPDLLVDPSVCDCCQTTLTAFLDGTALLAYRGRTDEEVRDIRTARFDGRAFANPRPLNNDDWRILACPINGPRLTSDGGRVAAAWFTGADNDPRVLASYSPDAGTRFLLPLTITPRNSKPVGHVDTTLLHDGAMLVTWVETDGSLWLRRVTPDFTLSEPLALAPAGTLSIKTNPRATLVRDYTGGSESAQFLLSFATDSTLRTLLVNVPEAELLVSDKHCDCAPTVEQLQGFSMRGVIEQVLPDTGMLRIRHPDIPGIFPAGTRDFKVAPETLAAVSAGRQFLGRIERRDATWRLFDVRLLASPLPSSKQ